MRPTKNTQATLVDLLERILDRGLVLHADIIIHVAGIPLLGVNLRAVLAGIETMLRFGMWKDWDEAQRLAAKREARLRSADVFGLTSGENMLPDKLVSH
ncbi:MAG TPA: gas vesicle protein [Firmicutes bacterium]|nr:gas vesicle protein [Candidatus Fermentithermobacillaceae bacterium]